MNPALITVLLPGKQDTSLLWQERPSFHNFYCKSMRTPWLLLTSVRDM